MIALLSRMTAVAVLKGSKSMARRKRWNHSPTFMAQVALSAIRGDQTLAELAQQYDIHPNRISDWKTQLPERLAQVFDGQPEPGPDLKELHDKIGQLTLANLFKKGRSFLS